MVQSLISNCPVFIVVKLRNVNYSGVIYFFATYLRKDQDIKFILGQKIKN